MTPCQSSVVSAVEGRPSGARSPSQPVLAKGNCLMVSNIDIIATVVVVVVGSWKWKIHSHKVGNVGL